MNDHHDDLHARVERGATLLDERQPGWADQIDLGTLNMSSCWFCVLGQLYEDFGAGAAWLFGENHRHWRPSREALEQATMHGFQTLDDDEQWEDLRDAWWAAIRDRRRGATND